MSIGDHSDRELVLTCSLTTLVTYFTKLMDISDDDVLCASFGDICFRTEHRDVLEHREPKLEFS